MNRKPLLTVFLIVFVDLMGFGIVIPLLPLYADRYHPSPAVFGLLMACYSLMQFIFTPVLGRLSDRFGRRPILLLSLAGTVTGYVLFGLQRSLPLLFVSRTVGGVMGANVATAQAVIADVTKPEERAKGMGLIGAAFGLGFIFGPAIGGVTVRLSESAPGFFAAALSLTALLLAAFLMPETWPAETRTQGKANRSSWFSIQRLTVALRHPQIGVLLVIFFLATFAFANFESTFALTLNKRMGLDPEQVMWLFVFVGVLAAIVQGGLIGRLVKRFGERRLILTGAVILVPGYLALIAAGTISQLFSVLPLLALGAGLTGPSLSSLVSRMSNADEQGGILGVYQSMASMARILGPFWGVFAFERLGMNFPYWTAAVVALLSTWLAAVVHSQARRAALSGHSLENDSSA